MQNQIDTELTAPNKGFVFLRLGAGLLIILAIGLWIIMRFAASQADQDLQNWQARMNLIADSRAAEVSTWLNRYPAKFQK